MSYYRTHVQIDTTNITRAIDKCKCKTAVELYIELTNNTAKYKKWGEGAFDDPDILKFIIGEFSLSFCSPPRSVSIFTVRLFLKSLGKRLPPLGSLAHAALGGQPRNFAHMYTNASLN